MKKSNGQIAAFVVIQLSSTAVCLFSHQLWVVVVCCCQIELFKHWFRFRNYFWSRLDCPVIPFLLFFTIEIERGSVSFSHRSLNNGNLLLELGEILKQKWHKTIKNGMLKLNYIAQLWSKNIPLIKLVWDVCIYISFAFLVFLAFLPTPSSVFLR